MAQRTYRDEAPSPEPLEMWTEVSRAAITDTAIAPAAVVAALDSAQVVYCMSWPYDDPVARLCYSLAATPRHRHYSGIGGTTPQALVTTTAEAMLRGEMDLALIAGGEALDTKRRLKKAGERPAWSHRHPEKQRMPFEVVPPATEIAHQVFQAYLTFAMFDVARRARVGEDVADHRKRLGELLSPMSHIAADNPHAWFPVARSADEIATATTSNRMVGFPYTKYMVAVMDVDMAAAIVVATHRKADELGVPADRRVYLHAAAAANDPWAVAERRDLSRSAAMSVAGSEALSAAGVSIDDVAHLDLYSCFASSVDFARDSLGIGHDDARALTVTGGLPYAGGPASNYMLHSIAALVEKLRSDPGSLGLASGVGMHMTKHAFGVYSTEPRNFVPPSGNYEPQEVVPLVDVHQGTAKVAAYTIEHGRDGDPEWGLLACDVADGTRCYARVVDRDLLDALEASEWVGEQVNLAPRDNVNMATV